MLFVLSDCRSSMNRVKKLARRLALKVSHLPGALTVSGLGLNLCLLKLQIEGLPVEADWSMT